MINNVGVSFNKTRPMIPTVLSCILHSLYADYMYSFYRKSGIQLSPIDSPSRSPS